MISLRTFGLIIFIMISATSGAIGAILCGSYAYSPIEIFFICAAISSVAWAQIIISVFLARRETGPSTFSYLSGNLSIFMTINSMGIVSFGAGSVLSISILCTSALGFVLAIIAGFEDTYARTQTSEDCNDPAPACLP